MLQCEAKLSLNCIAGPGRKLEPSLRCKQKLRDLCATNSIASSESDRVIAESLEFILKDKYGNEAKFPDHCVVVCRLSRLSFDKENYTIESLVRNTPQFVEPVTIGVGRRGTSDTGDGGVRVDQLTSIPMTQYSQSFPKIQLHPSDELIGGDGRVEVIFEVSSRVHQSECQSIEKFSFPFQFTTDEDRALNERRYREEILPFQEQLEQLYEEQRKGEREYQHVQDQLRTIEERATGLHLGEYLSTSQLSQSDVSLFLSLPCLLFISVPLLSPSAQLLKYELEKLNEKNDMLKANSHVRCAHKPHAITIPEQLILDEVVLGQVVDLAFVESTPPKLAEVISWAAAGYMHALVVPNDKPRREGYFRDQNISFWEMDRIVPFQNSKGKVRTKTEMQQQTLPLDLPRLPPGTAAPGNPRYLVCFLPLVPFSHMHTSGESYPLVSEIRELEGHSFLSNLPECDSCGD